MAGWRVAVVTWAVMFAGCSSAMRGTTARAPTAAEIADAGVPLRCVSDAQCARWWRAAQVWLVNNSALKLQIATDAVLQTYSSTASMPHWSFTITKAPDDAGVEVMAVRIDCAPGFACAPAYETVVADFKRHILGVR